MTATFNPDLGSDRDQLRAALGDTDVDAAYLTDEQIDAVLVTSSYDQALVTLGTQVLAQIPTKLQVVGLTVDMAGPISALKSVIAGAQSRLAAATVARTSTFQVRRPQRFGADGGSDYGRAREDW